MCLGCSVVHVKYEYCDDNRESYKDHGEKEVFPNKGDYQGSRRYGFCDNEEEHC